MREIINELTDTETAADDVIRKAEVQSEEIVARAYADGDARFAETKAKAEAQAAKIISDAKDNAAAIYDRILTEYDRKCNGLYSDTAFDTAVQNIVKNLT